MTNAGLWVRRRFMARSGWLASARGRMGQSCVGGGSRDRGGHVGMCVIAPSSVGLVDRWVEVVDIRIYIYIYIYVQWRLHAYTMFWDQLFRCIWVLVFHWGYKFLNYRLCVLNNLLFQTTSINQQWLIAQHSCGMHVSRPSNSVLLLACMWHWLSIPSEEKPTIPTWSLGTV
jgi:hypothetical protein